MWRRDQNYGGAFWPGPSMPPVMWNNCTRQVAPVLPRSEGKPTSLDRSFHVTHRLPAFDSPYARAKHVQLVDKDPHRAISMFWAAINAGDRVDSALKDMASAMKQVNRSDEAIEAIKSFRHLCSPESQDAIDNILLELFKRSGRMEEHIGVLQAKIRYTEDLLLLGGRRVKTARSHGRKCLITIEHEYSRLLGNLAWVYLQQDRYAFAEELYRKALIYEQDKNKMCNLAICLMYMNRMTEARSLLECATLSGNASDQKHVKSFERASRLLVEFESLGSEEARIPFSSFMRRDAKERTKKVLCTGTDSIISHPQIEGSKSASLGPGIGLQSSHNKTSFAGELNKEECYVGNYNERTGDNREMVPGGGIDYDGYMIGYVSPNSVGGNPGVPFRQPREGPSFSFDNTAGKCNIKLSFAGTGEQGSNLGLGQAFGIEECAEERKINQELQNQGNQEVSKYFSLDSSNRGWVNMQAEENMKLLRSEYLDENTNLNNLFGSLIHLNETERLDLKMGSLALEDGSDSQPSNAGISSNQEVRHSLLEQERSGQVWKMPWLFENIQ
ncbi:hypothetical protein DCAR_0416204 [Daucus carota subsp. sativus]|uniref:Uncharacterized protein n=2 Tax=Daucus carota subsp. sativus TaxID=79200 RepID=A0AAF0WXN8_DAUCS|nr:hypothetical protein DCAR_0416204 [Daucus carota subsp. sativus]